MAHGDVPGTVEELFLTDIHGTFAQRVHGFCSPRFALAAVSKRFKQKRERRRTLAAAWIVEVIT
jgi:hypothetical protein